MPFSHHSHSGQFCGHATNTLEEAVQDAISKNMTSFCMTEHIPRTEVDFYPGEADEHTEDSLMKLFDDYYHEARRLQSLYKDKIDLFVGFEGEWIRDSTLQIMNDLLNRYEFDLFVGSVHHVHTVPTDFNLAFYHKARDLARGTDERVFEDYFDAQIDMLRTLRPPVVGHFDLIRLYSDDPERSFKTWPGVWEKVLRNLKFVVEYGGVIELNSSSLRKGMSEAYPQVEICREFKALGGRFTVSDDSHGVSQIGLNYGKVLECLKRAGITELCYLAAISEAARPHDRRFPRVGWETMSMTELETHAFWKK